MAVSLPAFIFNSKPVSNNSNSWNRLYLWDSESFGVKFWHLTESYDCFETNWRRRRVCVTFVFFKSTLYSKTNEKVTGRHRRLDHPLQITSVIQFALICSLVKTNTNEILVLLFLCLCFVLVLSFYVVLKRIISLGEFIVCKVLFTK